MDILELLEQEGVIDAKTRERVAGEMQSEGVSAEKILLKEGVGPEVILEKLGAYYKLPIHLMGEHDKIEPSVLKYLQQDSAQHYKLLPLAIEDGVLKVGIVNPDDLKATDALNFISSQHNVPYKLVLILERDFARGLEMYENITEEVGEALNELEDELSTEIEARREEQEEESSEKENQDELIQEDAPVTKIVATVLRYAVDGNASDIHVEPTEDRVRVRFRVDGILSTNLELPKKVHLAVVARIKILSSMRLDEKRKPQDGRFSATIDKRKIDFRVSTFPTYYGEKVVMRILDSEIVINSLEATGLSKHNLELVQRAVKMPYGIILVSGPTGSGKSTTLHNMLSEIDRVGKNVLSLEDPVEYNIDNVSQSQVRPEIGYTFASGLRSILRQDPDVIMVGEIRDKETAQLAIQAALTGHLVLSTIHTNTSIGVVPRLIDMGVDPYLIAPTLVLAMGQRLVRRICPNTGKETPVEGGLKVMIDEKFKTLPSQYHDRIPKSNSVLYIEGNESCPNGTSGRIAITEAIEITDEIERLILENPTEEAIYNAARKDGFMDMKEDALIKALDHEIPFEEVNTLGGMLLNVHNQNEDGVDNNDVRSGGESV